MSDSEDEFVSASEGEGETASKDLKTSIAPRVPEVLTSRPSLPSCDVAPQPSTQSSQTPSKEDGGRERPSSILEDREANDSHSQEESSETLTEERDKSSLSGEIEQADFKKDAEPVISFSEDRIKTQEPLTSKESEGESRALGKSFI